MPEAGDKRGINRRWLRWVARVCLGLLGVVVLAIAALLVWKPQETLLLAAILIFPLIGNTRPPAIAADQFATATFQNRPETNRKLNALFRERFPTGTSETELKAELSRQGFKSLPPPRPDCLPEGQSAPLRQVITRCPTSDQSKVLEYRWGNAICSDTLAVAWSTDDGQKVKDVNASYYGACL